MHPQYNTLVKCVALPNMLSQCSILVIRAGTVCHAGPFRPLAIADTEAVAFPALPAFLGGGSAGSSGPPPSALEAAISASANAALPAVSGSDSFDFNVSKCLFCWGIRRCSSS